MRVLKTKRMCGAPRNAYESNSPRNADAPMTMQKPSAILIDGRTGMLASTTQVSTAER